MTEYSGLLTDLYELTMAAGYLQTGFDGKATFELFVRHLPPHRNYLVAAGLEQALEFLENVRFSPEDIAFLRQHLLFSNIHEEFFTYLANFRFTGDVWALPEGTLVFPGEPMLRVTAPIIEGQILETYLLATLELPDDGGEQGRARGDRGKRPPGRRFRRASRSRRSSQHSFCPRVRHRRLPGNL